MSNTRSHISHMSRRSFVEAAALAAGLASFGAITGCASASEEASTHEDHQIGDTTQAAQEQDSAAQDRSGSADNNEEANVPIVYMTTKIDSDAMQAIYAALGRELTGQNIAVKLSTGEPGSNYLSADLIAALVASVNGTIVECNTAYSGARSDTQSHYEVAADHGFTSIADFQIMDEDGSVELPVENGLHLSGNLVGAHFPEYDGFLVLSHFKGHAMAGFGGAIKNISIGIASQSGKCRIHTAGASDTSWFGGSTATFQESMADAAKSVVDALDGNILFINVMNRLSVDCDCDGSPAEPKMADIGILASADPVALDQACVDLIYESDDNSADLIARIESLNGEHTLEAAEQVGLGSRSYHLVSID